METRRLSWSNILSHLPGLHQALCAGCRHIISPDIRRLFFQVLMASHWSEFASLLLIFINRTTWPPAFCPGDGWFSPKATPKPSWDGVLPYMCFSVASEFRTEVPGMFFLPDSCWASQKCQMDIIEIRLWWTNKYIYGVFGLSGPVEGHKGEHRRVLQFIHYRTYMDWLNWTCKFTCNLPPVC